MGSALRSAPPVASTIRNVGEAYEARNFEGLENAQRLSLLFEQAVSRLLDGGSESKQKRALRRLVIFIDDLDRCSEHQTLRLLEAIKLYLQSRNCVFVFGMDMAAARRAVQRGTVAGQAEEAQEYLGKLFQTVLHVPVPRLTEGLTRDLLLYWGLDEGSTGVPIEALARDVSKLVEGNPRKIKNFINGLAVSWQLLKEHGCRAGFYDFLLMAYLQAYHADVYRLLVHDPSLLETFGRALTQGASFLETNAGTVERFFHRSFRHCFVHLPEKFQPANRKESDELVDELIVRIDRYSGDNQFLKLWGREAAEKKLEELSSTFGPILHGLESGVSETP